MQIQHYRKMKKGMHILGTIIIMLIVSGSVIRIVDAVVQIDDDMPVLILLLVVINCAIAYLSFKVYRKKPG